MSDTPLTDALLRRHQEASAAMLKECGLSVVRAHALQQVEELIEHARKMERALQIVVRDVVDWQCGCSLRERASGHRIDCNITPILAALQQARKALR